MGELLAIKSTITDRLPGAPRVILRVCVSMFDSLAEKFHDKFDGYRKEPKIVLVTSINPKIASGKSWLYLIGTSATRVFFDCETTVGQEAYNRFSSATRGIGVNAEVDTDLPRSLAAVVDNTYTFQLKLTDFNFTPNHQTFTISRIFPANELAPLPTFEEGAVHAEPPVHLSVAPGFGSKGISPCNVAGQSMTSDNPHEVLQTAVKEVDDPEGNAAKKAEWNECSLYHRPTTLSLRVHVSFC
ncbi:unnamed protein product [Eruca vesicaria subsp. sativa]|uniref:Uncharacterized protein n=1 Tax=Eruca vesicaria subsp. sativa TaxID=29727 RepID=A0ABC8L4N9_ERUVS|nr:unnamed protein product [Eruca vesicaria subsp. sativa]